MIIEPEQIENKDLLFTTNDLFEEVTTFEGNVWDFFFSNIRVQVTSLWRLLIDNKIKLVSEDYLQQFGLLEPIDVVEKTKASLTGKKLLEIKVVEHTGDLILSLSDNVRIEIFITSSGYESYNFSFENKTYIGMGSGDISMFDNSQLKQN